MFRVQHKMPNSQWVDLSRSPQGVFAQGLAQVRRTVSTDDAVRVVQDPIKRDALVDIVV